MKSCIVTTQYINNYGAVLQAYGLHAFLKSLNFQHDFLLQSSSPPKASKSLKGICVDTVNYVLKRICHNSLDVQKIRFENFRNDYFSQVSIDMVGKEYGLLITGGDQLFNRSCLNRPVNFLHFGSEQAKKISFCTSMGSASFNTEELMFIGKELSSYSELSFREKEAIDKLSAYTSIQMHTDIDCSFLIEKSEWNIVSSFPYDKLPDRYILVYQLMNHKDLKNAIIAAKKKFNLPVVSINALPRLNNISDYSVLDAGPSEFIGLFEKAEYVITTSFHGTCFSIIEEKPFFTLIQEWEKRIPSLLDNFGLSECYSSSFDSLPSVPDYSNAKKAISIGKAAAKDYFSKHMRKERETE